jgi:hypothetical protein
MRKKKAATVEAPVSIPLALKVMTTGAAGRKEPSRNGQPVSEEEIRLCAYRKWEATGRPAGDGVQFWLEAEKELLQDK